MKTLYTLTKVLSNERPRQSAAKQARSVTIKKVSSDDGWSEMEIELPDEIEEIDTSEPSRAEVRKAIGDLKNGKAPGIGNIQAEPLKGDIYYATT